MQTDDRLSGGYALPEELLIVGIDEIPQAIKDAYQYEDPYRLDGPESGLITSIDTFGVKTPVMVCSRRCKISGVDTRFKIVIDGRQRVLASRIVNARRKKQGDEKPGLVPFVYKEGDESTVIIANEWRRDDPTWVKATKLRKLLDRNYEMKEACQAFSEGGKPITRQTAESWLRLLKLTPDLLEKVKSGEIPYATGYELGKHPPAEQSRILEAILASDGTIKGANGVVNVKAVADVVTAKPERAPSSPAPAKSNGAPAKAPVIRDRTVRINPKHLAIIADVLAPTDAEPHENDEQRLAYAIFAVCAGAEEPEALKPWPWIHKIVKRAMK